MTTRNRVPLVVQRAVVTAVVLIAALSLSGCFFPFPSRPNNKPLYITPDGQNVTFLWCGEDSASKISLKLLYRKLQEGNDGFHTAAEGTGEYHLENGVEFTSLKAPEGFRYRTAEIIPLDYVPMIIFVYAQPASLDGPNDLATFFVDKVMESGRWYNQAGEEFAQTPC